MHPRPQWLFHGNCKKLEVFETSTCPFCRGTCSEGHPQLGPKFGFLLVRRSSLVTSVGESVDECHDSLCLFLPEMDMCGAPQLLGCAFHATLY